MSDDLGPLFAWAATRVVESPPKSTVVEEEPRGTGVMTPKRAEGQSKDGDPVPAGSIPALHDPPAVPPPRDEWTKGQRDCSDDLASWVESMSSEERAALRARIGTAEPWEIEGERESAPLPVDPKYADAWKRRMRKKVADDAA